MRSPSIVLGCALAFLAAFGPPAAAQVLDSLFLVQATPAPAPRRAQPIPNKPIGELETAKAARLNNWTVGVAGGLLEGTFSKYAADLGKALDDGDNLRVLPINTYGAVGNVTDLVYLKGVDFAITYADVLDYYKTVDRIPGIEKRVNYVIPMFQGEFHLLVRPEIKSIQDLAGKKVGFNTVGSAANYTGGIIFDRLGVKVERLFINNALALEGMRKGEIFGLVHAVGKPNGLFTGIKPGSSFHFLPLEYSEKFQDYYAPAELTNADYPTLIPQGQSISTISVQALLAVYNWDRSTDRFRRCVRFVEYLFDRFDKLREKPFEPGWKQVNLAGTIPGWTRFPPAQEVLDKMAVRPQVDPVLARSQAARAAPNDPNEQERLFRQFIEWTKRQNRQQ
ncbi:MAG: TAXI family TRAP transporter solute-binding subunit [Hyphomicrobiaceae bacterium]